MRTHIQEGRKSLCGQNFYEPSPLDFWRGFPLYSLHEYQYLRSVSVFPIICIRFSRQPFNSHTLHFIHPTPSIYHTIQGEVRGGGQIP